MIFGNQELLLKKVETISKLHQSVLVENEEKLEIIENLKLEISDLRNDISKKQLAIENSVQLIKDLKKRNSNLESIQTEFESKNNKILDKLEEQTIKLKSEKQMTKELKEKMTSLIKINKEFEGDNDKLNTENKRHEDELKEIKYKLKQLKKAEDFLKNPIYNDEREHMMYLNELEEIQNLQSKKIKKLQTELKRYKEFYEEKTFFSNDKKKLNKKKQLSNKILLKLKNTKSDVKVNNFNVNQSKATKPKIRNYNIISDEIFKKMKDE